MQLKSLLKALVLPTDGSTRQSVGRALKYDHHHEPIRAFNFSRYEETRTTGDRGGFFAGTFRVGLADKTVQALVPKNAKSDHPLFYGTGAILEDQGGLIWLGTRGSGLFKLNDNARRFAPGHR